MSKLRLLLVIAGVASAIAAVLLISAFWYIRSGGMIARQTPNSMEAAAARWVLDMSIPAEARNMKNPMGITEASVSAGRQLYQQKCEVCHGYDGSGKTDAGGGEYPPPRDLRSAETSHRTDGELFYLIRNGIRNTAMPGWQMPDHNTWQLVAYLRSLPKVAPAPSEATASASVEGSHYVGSAACESCHREIYQTWKQTPMANVVRDPKEHPDAILSDLSKPDKLVTFTKDDIALVYGSIWKQRYFKRVGDDYFPFGAQWDVTNRSWRPYKVAVGTDWWTAHYPDDNFQRPTGPLCDGCHSVNYNIKDKSVTEWNVGCERCHGPGSEHVRNAAATNILNPARMDYVQANDVCIQCHSQGQPLKRPIEGKYYDWPVGYEVGAKLSDFWQLEEYNLGETTFTHFADGTGHKNRMQGNDYVASLMYARGVACHTCHDSHGTSNNALLRKQATALCLDCHGPMSPNGPHSASIEQHTHHKAGSPGSECIACHMPRVQQTIGNVNVRSHTFRFVYPRETDNLKVPNACNVCHTDKTTDWATEALKTWSDVSPWRVGQ
jgi:predicted CXXCH cytochrome family protein